jgi:hypothetical protein
MVTITLDWLNVVALLGAVQGLILSGVLAARRRNRTANRILAVAMVALSIFLASSVYHAAGLERAFPHFFGAAYLMPLLYGPLIYLYAVTASDRSRGFTWRDALQPHDPVPCPRCGVCLEIHLQRRLQEAHRQNSLGLSPLRSSLGRPVRSARLSGATGPDDPARPLP